jgi:DNA-binding MarR family transcriptional regulator
MEMSQATKQQMDAMAAADQLRPTLLGLARELRRERIGGVSPHQVTLLVSIKYAPGVTVGELAADERVSTAAMSKRVSRLERDGLVARTPSETDRRRVGLTLTEDGQRTLRRVRSRRTAWLASRLGALTPAELAAVGAAVEPLARLLEAEERRA